MNDAERDLPSASVTPSEDTESRSTGRFVPLSSLWWNLLCASIVAVLAFVLFGLALAWDQWIWMAIASLPVAVCATVYSVWCLMMLQRFYLDERRETTQATQLPV